MSKRGKRVVIEVDGRFYEAEYLGRGQFSRVYRVGHRAIYYTKGDCAKEVLSMFQHERVTHLPEMIRHNNVTTRGGTEWYVFSSPYYRDVTTKDKSAWKMYKKLQNYYDKWYGFYWRQGHRGYYLMQAFVAGLEDDGNVPHSVTNALQVLVDLASNCGEAVGFDFHKKNFGVNEYGTLIFRDLIYVEYR